MTARSAFDRSLFELLGLPERFALDPATWKHAITVSRPSCILTGTLAVRTMTGGWRCSWQPRATRPSGVLSDPCQRAAYLCERHGASVDAERNTAMPSAFLVEQMAWREDIDEVRDMGDLEAAHRLQARLETERNRVIDSIATLIDEQGDYPAAAMQVRQLMFFERLRTNLADVVRQMGQG